MKAWGPAALWAAVLFGLSSLSSIPGSNLFPHEDKVGHFFLYGVMGAALARAHRVLGRGRAPHWALLTMGLAYGALDELHQSFVPGRDPDIHDWVVDGIAVALWYAATLYLARRASGKSTIDAEGARAPGSSPDES